MSVLSDRDIYQELESGGIIITPFNSKNVSNSSYDIRLGRYYYRAIPQKVHNPWSNEHNNRRWSDVFIAENPTEQECKEYDLKPEDRFIILEPNETILAHTEEFIGGRKNITSMSKTRSSLGRNFIDINKSAGWGDVGYINRWTLEITNLSPDTSQILICGERVGQIVFLRTESECINSYAGSYQSNNLIEEIISEWKPSMMLPRLKRDN